MMPRKKCRRNIEYYPKMTGFIPFGMHGNCGDIELYFEEYECMRLLDYIGLSQELAAEKLGVSRPTVTRIYEQARRKVATAFIEGKVIIISGGNYSFSTNWNKCNMCNFVFIEGNEANENNCDCNN